MGRVARTGQAASRQPDPFARAGWRARRRVQTRLSPSPHLVKPDRTAHAARVQPLAPLLGAGGTAVAKGARGARRPPTVRTRARTEPRCGPTHRWSAAPAARSPIAVLRRQRVSRRAHHPARPTRRTRRELRLTTNEAPIFTASSRLANTVRRDLGQSPPTRDGQESMASRESDTELWEEAHVCRSSSQVVARCRDGWRRRTRTRACGWVERIRASR